MAFTVNTTSKPLFGGTFYAQAQISVSKDPKNKKFTVKVDGIRAYCNKGWNFTTHLSVRLATDSSGSGAVSDTGSITRSYSDRYKGWLPKSGYSSDATVSKTFNYNSNGTMPAVYLYIRAYNGSIKYLSAGTYVALDSQYHANISSLIKDNYGNLDVSAPTFNLTKSSETIGVIGFSTSVTNSYKVNLWQVGIDSKTSNYEYTGETGISKTYNKNGAHTIYVRARNSYNNVWSDWKSVACDSRQPNINNFSLTPTASNKAKVNFTSDYDCYWKITGTNLDSGWKGPVTAKNSPDTEITVRNNVNESYTLNVKRSYNENLTNSSSIYCNTVLPVLTINKISTTGAQMKIDVSASVKCKDWTVKLIPKQGSIIEEVISDFDDNDKAIIIVNDLQMNVPYTITITATSVSNNLSNSTSHYNITCVGCVRLGDDDEVKLASIQIYDINKKAFLGAVPYVYDDNIKQWRQCT